MQKKSLKHQNMLKKVKEKIHFDKNAKNGNIINISRYRLNVLCNFKEENECYLYSGGRKIRRSSVLIYLIKIVCSFPEKCGMIIKVTLERVGKIYI